MINKYWVKIDRIYPYWINTRNDKEVSIINTLHIREKYYVQFGHFLNQQKKFFMTKSQALKFAKHYMRSN